MTMRLWIEDDGELRPVTDLTDPPFVRLEMFQAMELRRIVSLYFQMYLIPANELDRRSQAMAIRLGMPVKDLDEIRREMGDSWADLLIKHIHTELNP